MQYSKMPFKAGDTVFYNTVRLNSASLTIPAMEGCGYTSDYDSAAYD